MSTSIDSHMRESDALLWSLERSPLLRSTIVLVAVIEGRPPTPALLQRLERLSRVAPMFREHVVEDQLHLVSPMFVVDPHFDVRQHFHRFEAADPRTLNSVLEEAAKIGATAFDPLRPLWDCVVIDGIEGDSSAVIIKIHHTLTDGLGGVQLLSHLLDAAPDETQLGAMPAPPPPPDPRSGSLQEAVNYAGRQIVGATRSAAGKLLRTTRSAVRDPVATARDVAATTRSVFDVLRPPPPSMSPLFGERGMDRRYLVIDVPTARLRAAGHAADATLNDAFIAAVVGGLGIYHERHGKPVQKLSGSVPISVRKANDPLAGNRITAARFVGRVDLKDPAERVQAVHARMRQLRNNRAVPYLEAIWAVVNRMPKSYLQAATSQLDFTASNVPGLPVPVYCCGKPVRGMYPFGPTLGAPLNATLMSYADTCNIGINIDIVAIPDGDELLGCLETGLTEVLALADRVQTP